MYILHEVQFNQSQPWETVANYSSKTYKNLKKTFCQSKPEVMALFRNS